MSNSDKPDHANDQKNNNDHEHHHDGSCDHPLCNHGPVEPLTDIEEAQIEADPAAKSLSDAMKFGFTFLKAIMILLVIFFVVDRFRFVEEGEVMLIRRFGKYVSDPDTGKIKLFLPGTYYFLWPEPIDAVEVLPVSKSTTIDLDEVFWPRVNVQEASRGDNALSKRKALEPVEDGYNLTGDLNILHSKWKVVYKIDENRVDSYVLNTQDPTEFLRTLAVATIVRNFAATDVESVYYHDQDLFRRKVQSELANSIRRHDLGLILENVTVDPITPPGSAIDAFDLVTTAQTERARLIEEAHKQSNTIKQDSVTEAQYITLQAEHYKSMVVSRAKADAQRMTDLLEKFPDDPQGLSLYLAQYRNTRIRETLQGSSLYILRDGENIFWVRPDPPSFDDPESDNKGQNR